MEALKELIYKMADDALVIGHRNSEWTGLGPTLEEDIAFSSMAQDKIGHSLALYKILHENLGEKDPDSLAFARPENEFKCCHLTEIYSQDYAFALIRHFLYDQADYLRYEMLADSAFEPLAQLAKKVKGELKYHTMHADIWIKKLGKATEESKARMQSALNEAYPLALGIFEEGENEQELISKKVFDGEAALKEKWMEKVQTILASTDLKVPQVKDEKEGFGGRKGYHTEHLAPLLAEMREVYNLEPQAEW